MILNTNSPMAHHRADGTGGTPSGCLYFVLYFYNDFLFRCAMLVFRLCTILTFQNYPGTAKGIKLKPTVYFKEDG